MDYTTIINQSGVITTVQDTNFSVEIGLIILAVALGTLIYFKLSKLLGFITTIGIGVSTLYYGSINTTGYIFGTVGWIIISMGLIMMINYLFEPIKRK